MKIVAFPSMMCYPWDYRPLDITLGSHSTFKQNDEDKMFEKFQTNFSLLCPFDRQYYQILVNLLFFN